MREGREQPLPQSDRGGSMKNLLAKSRTETRLPAMTPPLEVLSRLLILLPTLSLPGFSSGFGRQLTPGRRRVPVAGHLIRDYVYESSPLCLPSHDLLVGSVAVFA
jgi:hypothetical protein